MGKDELEWESGHLAVLKRIDTHWDALWRGRQASWADCCFIGSTREFSITLEYLDSRNVPIASNFAMIPSPVQNTQNARVLECCTIM